LLDGHFAHPAGYSSAMPLDADHLSFRMPTGFFRSLLGSLLAGIVSGVE
jgi:hypothetical protein